MVRLERDFFSFWFAYVATRPRGASFADWMSKPKSVGGLNLGDGPVALALTVVIFVLVAYLPITRVNLQSPQPASTDEAHLSRLDALPQGSVEPDL